MCMGVIVVLCAVVALAIWHVRTSSARKRKHGSSSHLRTVAHEQPHEVRASDTVNEHVHAYKDGGRAG